MYEIFHRLLLERGIKTAEVARATGLSQTLFSDWKSGKSSPKQDKMQKIADYFGVSIEYLMTGKEREIDGYYSTPETARIAQEIFERPDLHALFDAASDVSPESLKQAIEIIKILKGTKDG